MARSRTPPRSPSAATPSSTPTTRPSPGRSSGSRTAHGYALLYDCHSIRSHVPRLFPGELPVLNLGTNDGDPVRRRSANSSTPRWPEPLSHVTDGRFKGGWITRHYGRPAAGIHAVQMELAQSAYMHEDPPYAYDHDKAQALQPTLLAPRNHAGFRREAMSAGRLDNSRKIKAPDRHHAPLPSPGSPKPPCACS
jgi:hypothetical protein